MQIADHCAQGMLDGTYLSFEKAKPQLQGALSYLAHGIAYVEKYPKIASIEIPKNDKNQLALQPLPAGT